jgi:large subunit ribosomal protein L20
MPRAKRGFKARRRRNRVLKHASGYYSARSRLFGAAIEQVHNAWADAYAHRRRRKRDFRRLWITRISAAAKLQGISYSRLVGSLKTAGVLLEL